MSETRRLDHHVGTLFPAFSRHKIQGLIKDGKVLVSGRVTHKPGHKVAPDATITIVHDTISYVSRAGTKLAHALDHFTIDVQNLVVLDAGLSTGGFSDCLLQRGVKKIFGVDVGHGQVHPTIAADERVVVMEGTNLRTLAQLPELVDLVTLDLSFISVSKVLPAVARLLKDEGTLVVLIKPQFEAEPKHRNRKGVITDDAVHQGVIQALINACQEHGFEFQGVTPSPIVGSSGNKEFLGYWIKKK
jgi:23S rRNA (cytidine1920-2'-O)/16S rRNA (cytidine1409-2'-O)-methyltransferase